MFTRAEGQNTALSLTVDEILLPRYVKWSYFIGLPLKYGSFLFEILFIYIHLEASAPCCLL